MHTPSPNVAGSSVGAEPTNPCAELPPPPLGPATHRQRPSWDDYFLAGALWVASRADCRRRQHGAVIVKNNRPIATGYNGAPSGKPGCLEGACPRGLASYDDVAALSSYDTGPGACIAIHAEANALLHSEFERIQGATLYVTGEPCDGCKRLIAGAGIERVVWPGGDYRP